MVTFGSQNGVLGPIWVTFGSQNDVLGHPWVALGTSLWRYPENDSFLEAGEKIIIADDLAEYNKKSN